MILATLPQMFVALVASGIALVSQPLFAKCAINPEYYSSKHPTCSAAIPADGSAPGRLEPTPHRYSQGDDDHRGSDSCTPFGFFCWSGWGVGRYAKRLSSKGRSGPGD